MSVILILAITAGLIGIVILWGVYREAKLNKAWDEAYEEDWVRAHNSVGAKSKTSSQKTKGKTKAKVGRPTKKAS